MDKVAVQCVKWRARARFPTDSQIEIVGLPVLQLSSNLNLNLFRLLWNTISSSSLPKLIEVIHLVRVPKLANDEQLLPLNEALIQGSLQSLAGFVLISVIACRIKHSKARLDGLINGVGTDIIGNLPETLLAQDDFEFGLHARSWNATYHAHDGDLILRSGKLDGRSLG